MKRRPGGLERSIDFEKTAGGKSGAVFVAANSEAGKYAKKIHDERGRTWQKLGAGSIAKSSGARVGEKFIDRVPKEEDSKILAIGKDSVGRVT